MEVQLLADGRRNRGDLAVGDLLLDVFRRRDVCGVRIRADRPEPNALLIETEDRVAATLEGAVLSRFGRQEDRGVDALQGARQDVRAEKRLISIDADAPDLLLLRRQECTEAAATSDLEDGLRACRDLVEGELLALRLVFPVLRVAPLDVDPRDGGRCSGPVAGDVAVDRRLLEARDGADGFPPARFAWSAAR